MLVPRCIEPSSEGAYGWCLLIRTLLIRFHALQQVWGPSSEHCPSEGRYPRFFANLITINYSFRLLLTLVVPDQ
jgi:hypothetical protein